MTQVSMGRDLGFVSHETISLALVGAKAVMLRRRGIDHRSTDIIDLVICLLSIVGCMVIIVPHVLSKKTRKLRHSLILGLATSDLVSSVIIVCTSSFIIAGGSLEQAPKFCTFAGYILATSIWTQHLWNLSIAVITYMILVRPLSSIIHNIEKHLIWLWPIFWAIALIVNGIAWGLIGFADIGGYCSFDPQRAGPRFSAIFQFVPRAAVVAIIVVLYTHLFFFLRRTNLFSMAATRTSKSKGSASGTESSPLARTDDVAETTDAPDARRGSEKEGAGDPEAAAPVTGFGNAAASRRQSGADNSDKVRTDSRRPSQHDSFVADQTSDSYLTLGGSAAFLKNLLTPSSARRRSSEGTSSGHAPSSSTQDKGSEGSKNPAFDDIEMVTRQDYGNTAQSSHEIITNVIGNNGDEEEHDDVRNEGSPLTLVQSSADVGVSPTRKNGPGTWTMDASSTRSAPRLQPSAAIRRPNTAGSSNRYERPQIMIPPRPSTGAGLQGDRGTGDLDEMNDSDSVDSNFDAWLRKGGLSSSSPFQTMPPRRDVRDFGMTSAPREHLKHYSLTPKGVETFKRALETGAPHSPALPCSPAVSRKNTSISMSQEQSPSGGPHLDHDAPASPVTLALPPVSNMASDRQTETSAKTYEEALGDDWTWGMEVGAPPHGKGASGTHEEAAAASRARKASDDGVKGAEGHRSWWQVLRGKRDPKRRSASNGIDSANTTSSESTGAHGVELLGSTLNRQASVLLLLYPGVYCLLFSISIIRIIVDLAGPPSTNTSSQQGKQDDALHAVSRWTIFAQGLIDAIIFQVIERQFRRRMKRKRRIAAGETIESSYWFVAIRSAWARLRGRKEGQNSEEK